MVDRNAEQSAGWMGEQPAQPNLSTESHVENVLSVESISKLLGVTLDHHVATELLKEADPRLRSQRVHKLRPEIRTSTPAPSRQPGLIGLSHETVVPEVT